MVNIYPDFLSLEFPKTLVLFGRCGNPLTTLGNIGSPATGKGYKLSGNSAVFSLSSPGLRFSTPGWLEISPQRMLGVQSTETLFQMCREHIINSTSQFSGPIRLFLANYFRFVHCQIEKYQNELERVEGELFVYQDWIFSAWLPMPQAHILLPLEFMNNQPCFAEFDIVFWAEGKLIGIDIDSGETPIKSRKNKLEYLVRKHPNLLVVKVPKEKLEEDNFPIELFPTSFAYFWRMLKLPHGPFAPKELSHDRLIPNERINT